MCNAPVEKRRAQTKKEWSATSNRNENTKINLAGKHLKTVLDKSAAFPFSLHVPKKKLCALRWLCCHFIWTLCAVFFCSLLPLKMHDTNDFSVEAITWAQIIRETRLHTDDNNVCTCHSAKIVRFSSLIYKHWKGSEFYGAKTGMEDTQSISIMLILM